MPKAQVAGHDLNAVGELRKRGVELFAYEAGYTS